MSAYRHPPSDEKEEAVWAQYVFNLTSPSPSSFPTTGIPFNLLTMAGSMLMPMVMPSVANLAGTVTQNAAGYILRESVTQLTKSSWGSEASSALVHSMLTVPFRTFQSRNRPVSDQNTALATIRSLSQVKHDPAHLRDIQQQVLSSSSASGTTARYWALALGALGTLYFEFTGMHQMTEELPRLSSLVAPATGTSNTALIDSCKSFVHRAYSNSPYYLDPKNISVMDTTDVSAVRIVYNILVGLNTTFFTLLRSSSLDPTAELIHWGGIWFYWEILAQLVHLYGFTPVSIAYRQLYAQLAQLPALPINEALLGSHQRPSSLTHHAGSHSR